MFRSRSWYKKELRKLLIATGIRHARHHKKPRSRGGKNNEENISIVPYHLHSAWHLLFSNHSPNVIAEIINERWLDPDFEFVVRRKNENARS